MHPVERLRGATISSYRSCEVLVLYLDRPGWKSVCGAVLWGRFGYSDLKEVAVSGAAELWTLNRLDLLMSPRDAGVVVF
jgi:hypothetical protein